MRIPELNTLFAAPVGACVATLDMYECSICPQDATHTAQWADRRRREFAAGREAARAALQRLGAPPCAIPIAPDRSPVWPMGIVGSIAHCEGYCAAVVARSSHARGIGFDAEAIGTLPLEASRSVVNPIEQVWLDEYRRRFKSDLSLVLFSAKEAFYKCYFPITHHALDFSDTILHITEMPLSGTCIGGFQIEVIGRDCPQRDIGRRTVGRWATDGRIVLTAATLMRA